MTSDSRDISGLGDLLLRGWNVMFGQSLTLRAYVDDDPSRSADGVINIGRENGRISIYESHVRFLGEDLSNSSNSRAKA